MHGLVNRSIESFLRDTYGDAVWAEVAFAAGLQAGGFEAMLDYDDALTDAVFEAAAGVLRRPRETVQEDLGIYLVSHPNRERLRRLLRFGGTGFVDFLHSLDDLQGRGRLAVPDLDLPALELRSDAPDRFRLTCRAPVAGSGHVIVGLLRAMADDYGALVMLEHDGTGPEGEIVSIHLADSRFARGRHFDLAARAV